jgi:hypothetical protein
MAGWAVAAVVGLVCLAALFLPEVAAAAMLSCGSVSNNNLTDNMTSFTPLTFTPAVYVPQRPKILQENLVVGNLILTSGHSIGGAFGTSTLSLGSGGFANPSNVCSYVNYLGQNFYDVALSFAIQTSSSPGTTLTFQIINLPGVSNPWGAEIPVVNITTNMPSTTSVIDTTGSTDSSIPIQVTCSTAPPAETTYLFRVRIFYQAQA